MRPRLHPSTRAAPSARRLPGRGRALPLLALILAVALALILALSAGLAWPVTMQATASAQAAPATASDTGASKLATAPAPATPYAPAAASTLGTAPAGSFMQTILALSAVLGLLVLLAWFLKRYGPKAKAGGASMRIVGALNLGGRERIMVVEVGEQWIVVGASPGRVNALATMPRQQDGAFDADAPAAMPLPGSAKFADWLKQTIDKRNAH